MPGIIFFKLQNDVYKATITPQTTGFNKVVDAEFAVNYKSEFADLGFNPGLEDVVLATGGSMYEPGEVDRMIDEVKSRSKRTIVKKVYVRWPFIIAAILLFLVDILTRKFIRKP